MFIQTLKSRITLPLALYLVVFLCCFGSTLINANIYKNNINDLTNENNDLKANYAALEQSHADLQDLSNNQSVEMDRMEQTITDLQAIPKVESNYGVEKTWMSYRAIGAPGKSGWVSPQWKVQQKAYTDEKGFRKVDEYYCIAIGFGWGYKVGDTVLVVLSNGNSFKAIMGDEKALEHTDEETHKVHIGDNSVVEFIIDPNVMDPYYSRRVGIKAMPEFAGSVVGIYKLGFYDI